MVFRYKIATSLLVFLLLMNVLCSGSTMAYTYSLSATCTNTFTSANQSITTEKETTERKVVTTTEKSTNHRNHNKYSPQTGNNFNMTISIAIPILVSSITLWIINKKSRRE